MPTTTKRSVGRPATGITKGLLRASVDFAVIAQAKKSAKKSGESLSNLVNRALRNELSK